MTDFLGKELIPGDKVVALSHNRTSSTLYLGEVEKLTNKMVVIKTVDSEHDWRYGETMYVSPYKVVKVNTVSLEAYKQKAWELDIALAQLREIGKSFGERMDDIIRHGRWLPVNEKEDAFDCSECDAMVQQKHNFCPKCGAKMDLDEAAERYYRKFAKRNSSE